MNKLIKRSIVFVALVSTIFVVVSFTNHGTSNKEVLLVEVMITPPLSGVYIYYNDKPTEFIKSEISEKMITEIAESFQSTLQKLYNDGWKLEGTNGGDVVQRYILTK
jgi:hypothetical protein